MNVACALTDEHQFQKGDTVCIRYNNSDHSAILALAVICAGGIVSTAFPKDPYAEILYLAQRVEPKFLFCHWEQLHWAKRLEKDLGQTVVGIVMGNGADSTDQFQHFDHLLQYNHRQSQSRNMLPRACEDNVSETAFLVMSSGTTGKPKAVPRTHFNHLVYSNVKPDPSLLQSKYACVSSLDYLSGWVLTLLAYIAGFTAVIIETFEPKNYLQIVERYKITDISLGAASLHSLITHPDIDKYDLSSVKEILPIGAKILYLEELKNFLDKHPQVEKIRHVYGATEFSGVTRRLVDPVDYLADPHNCGKLVAGAQAKIVDLETGLALGPNKQGMLHIRCVSLFPGYYDIRLAKDGAHSSPFIRDSSIFDEDGFYITGDIAYFSDQGDLFIIGRHKEVMSCRGALKVFPQELEDAICEHPAVEQAYVLGIASKLSPLQHCPRAFVLPVTTSYSDQCDTRNLLSVPSDAPTDEDCPEKLEFKGQHKLCRLPEERRRIISVDIMRFVNRRVGWEKQLTGGIVILDEIPTLRATGKVDKSYLRSITLDQVEIYGDRSS